MKRNLLIVLTVALFALVAMGASDCNGQAAPVTPRSSSGVKKVNLKVKTQANGLTVEQENVKRRVELDNMPGSIKHLYVISAMTGDVIIYSTVDGKVTSSGKRATPYHVLAANGGQYADPKGIIVNVGGKHYLTSEVLQDDGTYGSSVPYVYWFDAKGVYHQHYITGGQIFHVTDKPIAVPKVILNMETMAK